MTNANTISGLSHERSILMGELIKARNDAAILVSKIKIVDDAIMIFDPHFDLAVIRPQTPLSGPRLKKGTISKGVVTVMKEAGVPLTSTDIATALIMKKNLPKDIQSFLTISSRVMHRLWLMQKAGWVKVSVQNKKKYWELV